MAQVILHILLCLGIIIISTKFMGTIVQKIGFPQVAGEIIAGLLLKALPIFAVFGAAATVGNQAAVTNDDIALINSETQRFISYVAEIGVIMIMYSAGLGTNLHELLKSGIKATIIAACGVIIPLIMGTILALCFWGFPDFSTTQGTTTFFKAMFIGTILTATSVSITVATLKELGKINSTVGQTIVSAAIIDDVFGIIVLTIVIGVSSGNANFAEVIIKTLLFFAASIVAGIIIYKLFKWYDARHEHTRRIAIYGLGTALIFAYCAEKFFGIADITGAYVAGVIFCSLHDAEYMEKKIDTNSYMFFSPVFFASIGLKTSFSGVTGAMVAFALCFVAVGLVSKIIGCAGVSRLLGFRGKECLQIGCGMMVRGEVALIVAQKGLTSGLVERQYFAPVILLIIISSMIVPVALKYLFKERG